MRQDTRILLGLGHAALKSEENQVRAAAHTEFAEEIRDVKLNGALGDVEFIGDFLVRLIFQQRIQDFLFAAAEIGDRIGFQAASLTREHGIDEAGEKGAGHPETAVGNERQGADKLIARFNVGEEAFYALAEERIAVGIVVLFADDDEARFGKAFEKIGQKRPRSRAGGVSVDDVDLSAGRFEIAQVGRKGGFELLGDDLELGFRQNPFELAQHQRVRREYTHR